MTRPAFEQGKRTQNTVHLQEQVESSHEQISNGCCSAFAACAARRRAAAQMSLSYGAERTDVDADRDRAQRVRRSHHRLGQLGGAQARPEGAAVLAEGLLQLLHQPVRVRDLRRSAATFIGFRGQTPAFRRACHEDAR